MAKKEKAKSGGPKTAVKVCVCKSEYQDRRYGNGRRLMNRCKPKSVIETFRCSVCGKEY